MAHYQCRWCGKPIEFYLESNGFKFCSNNCNNNHFAHSNVVMKDSDIIVAKITNSAIFEAGITESSSDIKRDTLMKENKQDKETVFKSGAIRKVIKESGHMICPEFDRRVGLIYSEGLINYKDKKVEDYAEVTTARFGLPLDNLLRHLHNHYLRFRNGDITEDNLAKVGWGIQQIMHQQDPNCQHYNQLVRPVDRILKPNSLYGE